MKKYKLLLLLALFIPFIVNAQTTITADIPQNVDVGEEFSFPINIQSDDQIQNVKIITDQVIFTEFEASDNWKIVSAKGGGYGAIIVTLEPKSNNTNGELGTIKFSQQSEKTILIVQVNNEEIYRGSSSSTDGFNMFNNYPSKLSEDNIPKSFTIEVPNSVEKLIVGEQKNKNENKYVSLTMTGAELIGFCKKIEVNGQEFPLEEYKGNISNQMNTFNEVVYDDHFAGSYWGFDFADLKEGDNTIVLYLTDELAQGLQTETITLNLIREKNTESNDEPTTDENKPKTGANHATGTILPEEKEEPKTIEKIYDEVITNPDTGTWLTITLSLLSIMFVTALYVMYYSNKKSKA